MRGANFSFGEKAFKNETTVTYLLPGQKPHGFSLGAMDIERNRRSINKVISMAYSHLCLTTYDHGPERN